MLGYIDCTSLRASTSSSAVTLLQSMHADGCQLLLLQIQIVPSRGCSAAPGLEPRAQAWPHVEGRVDMVQSQVQ
jgi:hypothetical protein